MTRNRTRLSWRVFALAGFLALATAGIVARLADIQLVNHDHYLAKANAEHVDRREIPSTRGAILDRNGFPLATSVEVFDLYIDRRAWERHPERALKTAEGLATHLGQDVDTLLARLQDSSGGPIELLEAGIDYEIGSEIRDLNLPGVTLAEATERFYPEGDLASALLGFLGRDHSGLAGLEADLDNVLSGTPGYIYFERDGGGEPIPFARSAVQPGEPGADVRLTIDRYIQRLIEDELDFQLEA